MVESLIPQDHFTYTYVLTSCAALLHRPLGFQVHARLLKSGHVSDLFAQNSLLRFYSAAGDIAAARRVFAGISNPDVVSWTSLVSALVRNGREWDAVVAFASMEVKSNEMTLVSVLGACCCVNALDLGRSLHGICVRRFAGNVILDNAMLNMYVRCGDMIYARQMFDEIPRRDVISWTTLISGYARNGESEEAVEVFREMLVNGEVMPNEATVVSVLCALASLGALGLGKLVHSYMIKSQIGEDGIVGNALINMYAKCGDVGVAFEVFKGLSCKDLVSWCSIVGGMAINGRAKQALQLFSLMICHGVVPDGVAFLALLSACCHAGLVGQASVIFDAMSKVYGIMPKKEHYTCMLDAYCRAGQFERTEKFVKSMPDDCSRYELGALLRASNVHSGNETICKHIKEWILGGEVDVGGGTFALLSNILAAAGRWEDADTVRDQMTARKIDKTVASSWIKS
ncbi:putative pentatricopeptide repeat-containing protein At3g05240 [Typha latifolia]|uniref:putative pentatricopeptide repeat-containing protein At3g05240 n=1 Tax=Typha latifolia TaxID=4733 RepID=UPI003C2F4BC4